MLYAVGFEEEDFKKPQIGIASTWAQVTPCNVHIDKLAIESAKGADAAGGKAIIFNTITISDGISMGTEGMKYSLVSREVIADSIETVVGCEGLDGYVAIGGLFALLVAHTVFAGKVHGYTTAMATELFAHDKYLSIVLETPGKLSDDKGDH